MIVGNKYKITEKIGEGSFGAICKGTNIRTGEEIAVKIESLESQTKLLKKEAQVYQYIGISEGFPQVKWFGVDDKNQYMVIDLLGPSLKDIIGKMSVEKALQYGVQMIERIQVLHSKKMIHRDIKPDNFLFGLGSKSDVLHLIDYGFSKSYIRDNDGKHIDKRINCSMIGTPNFVSWNVRNGIEPSRRDDVESIIKVLMFMTDDTDSIFNKLLNCIRGCEFSEEPDYEHIKKMMNNE